MPKESTKKIVFQQKFKKDWMMRNFYKKWKMSTSNEILDETSADDEDSYDEIS